MECSADQLRTHTETYDKLEIVGPPVVPAVDTNSLKYTQFRVLMGTLGGKWTYRM